MKNNNLKQVLANYGSWAKSGSSHFCTVCKVSMVSAFAVTEKIPKKSIL